MVFQLNDVELPQYMESSHTIAYPIKDNGLSAEERGLITRSGVIMLPDEDPTEAHHHGRNPPPTGMKGGAHSWRSELVAVEFDLSRALALLHGQPPPEHQFFGLVIEQKAALVSLNSSQQLGNDPHPGASVNEFELNVRPGEFARVFLEMYVAVFGSNNYLYRVGYHFTIIGRLVTNTQIP